MIPSCRFRIRVRPKTRPAQTLSGNLLESQTDRYNAELRSEATQTVKLPPRQVGVAPLGPQQANE